MNLLATRNGKRLLFAALYFSEGAPIGFIWWALPAQMRMAGFSIEHITGLTSLLVLPWMFKFLWAPLVDVLRNRFWTFKSWVLAMQGVMGSSFLLLSFSGEPLNSSLLVPLLFLHAVSAATQDVAIDALAINTVPAYERGLINGWMQGGMLLGRSLFSGGTLLMIAYVGEQAMLVLLAAAIWCSSLLLILSDIPETGRGTDSVTENIRSFKAVFLRVVKDRVFWFGIGFALTAGAAFEAVGAVAGPLLVDRGISKEEVALFFGVNVVTAMVVGALAGGWSSDRWGNRITLNVALAMMVVSVLVVALIEGRAELLIATLTMMYFWIGAFTSASYTLFMNITDSKTGATQFSTYMGATNGCESWATYGVGRAIPVLGYGGAFLLMCLPSLVGMVLLRWIPDGSDTHAHRPKISR